MIVFFTNTISGNGTALASINIMATLLLVTLAATGSAYRKSYLSLLEQSYILNIGLLAAGTIYIQYIIQHSDKKEALFITSAGIAFLQFIATVVFHAYVQLHQPLLDLIAKMMKRGEMKGTDQQEALNERKPILQHEVHLPHSHNRDAQFRESWLEYLSDD